MNDKKTEDVEYWKDAYKKQVEYSVALKEAAEFWKKKYDDYYAYMDKFLDETLGKIKEIAKAQEENNKIIRDMMKMLGIPDETRVNK